MRRSGRTAFGMPSFGGRLRSDDKASAVDRMRSQLAGRHFPRGTETVVSCRRISVFRVRLSVAGTAGPLADVVFMKGADRPHSFRSPVFRRIGCDGRGIGPGLSSVPVVRQDPAGKRPGRPRRRARANIGSRCRTIRCGGRQESAGRMAVSAGGGLSALILPSLPEDARARRSGNKEGTAEAVPSPCRMRRVPTASRRNALSIRSSF